MRILVLDLNSLCTGIDIRAVSPLIYLDIIVPKFVTLVLNFRTFVPHSCPTLVLGKSTVCFNGTQQVGRIEGNINIYFNDDGRSLRLESEDLT